MSINFVVSLPHLEVMAKDEVYELAVASGNWLLNMMLASDYEAGQRMQPPQNTVQSTFTSAQDLDDYGYTKLPWDPVVGEGTLDGLEPVFAVIGADAKMAEEGGENVLADYKHTGECTFDSVRYHVSYHHHQK
jgi:hypothetical protein